MANCQKRFRFILKFEINSTYIRKNHSLLSSKELWYKVCLMSSSDWSGWVTGLDYQGERIRTHLRVWELQGSDFHLVMRSLGLPKGDATISIGGLDEPKHNAGRSDFELTSCSCDTWVYSQFTREGWALDNQLSWVCFERRLFSTGPPMFV